MPEQQAPPSPRQCIKHERKPTRHEDFGRFLAGGSKKKFYGCHSVKPCCVHESGSSINSGVAATYKCEKCDACFTPQQHCELVRGAHFPITKVEGKQDRFQCGSCKGEFSAKEVMDADKKKQTVGWDSSNMQAYCVMRTRKKKEEDDGFVFEFSEEYDYHPLHDFEYLEHDFGEGGEGCKTCKACALALTPKEYCAAITGYHSLHREAYSPEWRCEHCGETNWPAEMEAALGQYPQQFALIARATEKPESRYGGGAKFVNGGVDIKVLCEQENGGLKFECPFCYESYTKSGEPRKNSKHLWHRHGAGGGQRSAHCGSNGEKGKKMFGGSYAFHLVEPTGAQVGGPGPATKMRKVG